MNVALHLWLWVTAIALALLAIWPFAPMLVFMALLLAALGALAAAMIGLAHCLPPLIAWMRAALARMALLARRLRAGRH